MGLKWKQTKRISFNANSEKNLVLRQQFALRMVDLLHQGFRILNIDETWLSDTMFIRKKWREHGSTNSVVGNSVSPRLSLILAFDSHGEVYLSMTQVNTNESVMSLYISHLVNVLDNQRPDWRRDTVLLLDGAGYHKSTMVRDHLAKLGVPVIYTGPRSYDAAPCELFFSQLKNGDLNPLGFPTGKR
jgi:hypothetical protein